MTGLIGWWPLNDESGDARDLSGEARHANVYDGVERGLAGKGGLTAYKFDRQSIVQMGKNVVDNLSSFTISIWAYVDSFNGADSNHGLDTNVVSNADNGTWGNSSNDSFQLGFDKIGRITLYLDDDGNHDHVHGETEVGTKEWHLLTVTHDGSKALLYLDAQLEREWQHPLPMDNNNTFHIGAGYDTENALKGKTQDLRVYNRVLSALEIKTLYEWGSGSYTDRRYHDGGDSGAVSRWKFDEDSDASTAVDSWNSINGSISGAVYTSNAVEGKALSFDGSNDSVSISSQDLDISGSKSVSAWVKMDGTASSEYQRVFQTGTGSGGRAYEMWVEDENSGVSFGRAIFRLNHDQSPSSKTCEYIIPDFDYKQWHHYTTVFDYSNGEMRIYINGVLREVVSYSQQIGSETDHYVGNWADSGDRPWNGVIDDVRVYNRALESGEVFHLYQWGTRGRDMRKLTLNQRG